MGIITCTLFALAHIICIANGSLLNKPIALSVLSSDLQSLEAAFPSADLWSDSKMIKYDEHHQIAVIYYQQTARDYSGQSFLMVSGRVTLAKIKRLQNGLFEMVPTREVSKLLFHNAHFYFETPESDPLLNVGDYYITEYHPIFGGGPKKPTVEYVSEIQLASELKDALPTIRYESSLTGAKLVNTYFRMKNNNKVAVQYDQQNDVASFSADYEVLVTTDERNIKTKRVELDKLSFTLHKQSSPESAQLRLLHGIKVPPPPSQSSHAVSSILKIKRDHLLKDLLQTRPVQKTDGSSTVGMIKYDSNKIYTANYIETNKKNVLNLIGNYMADDGTYFKRLCLAFPERQTDPTPHQTSDVCVEKPVFFSCPLDNKSGDVQIVLQEDDDYIELDAVPSRAIEIAYALFNIEPYLEYISYEQFSRTMLIVTNAMKLRCKEGYLRRSFRLFMNVFLDFRCKSGVVHFDALDLWLKPDKSTSSVVENLPGVLYDSNTKRFESEGSILESFKVRQLFPVIPEVPVEMTYRTFKEPRSFAIELNSIEWDLQDTRNNMLKNLLPQWGVIFVDDFVLFVAEKSKEAIGGKSVTTIQIKCDITDPQSFPETESSEAEGIVYDGNRITVKSGREVKSDRVPTKVYWSNNNKLPILNDIFSVTYKLRYIKLQTFKKHMKELAEELTQHCSALKKEIQSDAKLTFHVQYSYSMQNFYSTVPTIIAYYDCALNYIFFTSDFKIIRFADNRELSTSHQPGEESTIAVQKYPGNTSNLSSGLYFNDVTITSNINQKKPWFESEEDYHRRKYAAYILQDLLYDPDANILHSKSMLPSEVYALRPLLTNVRESSPKGILFQMKVKDGPEVYVYNYG